MRKNNIKSNKSIIKVKHNKDKQRMKKVVNENNEFLSLQKTRKTTEKQK